jgi:hypothetical protein
LYGRALNGAVEEDGLGVERILLSMAKLAAYVGERARAAELLACAYQSADRIDRTFLAFLGGRELEEELREGLPPEVYAAAQERGRARDVEATLRELWVEVEGEGSLQGE